MCRPAGDDDGNVVGQLGWGVGDVDDLYLKEGFQSRGNSSGDLPRVSEHRLVDDEGLHCRSLPTWSANDDNGAMSTVQDIVADRAEE